MSRVYTVYGLFSSLEPLEIRYVGFTAGKITCRRNIHCSLARNRSHPPVRQWIQEVCKLGGQVETRALQTADCDYWARILEFEWIAYFLRKQTPLVNVVTVSWRHKRW